MKFSPRKRSHARQPSEAGVTLIEMMIAILVLTIGLVALAQLFVAATMNNSYVVQTAGGINDAQRLLEHWKYLAAQDTVNGVSNAAITSSAYNTGTGQSQAFVDALTTNYSAANDAFKEDVWVYKSDGTLVGTNANTCPVSGLMAPTLGTRLVFIQMVPKNPDPRTNQTITLMTVIGATQ
jgi:prepilin-type N-terminal cleavage/methylation domain-containing protein